MKCKLQGKSSFHNTQLSLTAVILFIIIALYLGLPEPAWGNSLDQVLEINPRVSIGDYVRNRRAIPVTVDIRNLSNQPFKGKLSLIDQTYIHKSETDTVYREISIPQYGNKRFHLVMPASSYNTSKVLVRLSRNKEVSERELSLRSINDRDKLLMILSQNRGSFTYLNNIRNILPPDTTINITYPEQAALPIHWSAYSSCDIILINNYSSLKLDANQEEALIQYLKSGGKILISTSLDPIEYNQSRFQKYLPFLPRETRNVPAESSIFKSSNALMMDGTVQGKVDLYAGNAPLLTSSRVGEGILYFCTVDLSRSPLNENYEEQTLWNLLLEVNQQTKPPTAEFNFRAILATAQEISAPPVWQIFWLLCFYGLLVGPINYQYLKKKDKLIYLFITIPVISILFSTLIFFIGLSTKGTNIIARTFSVVYSSPGNSAGKVETAFSLFSPAHRKYNIEFTSPSAFGWELSDSYPPPAEIRFDEHMTFMNQNIEMWSMRRYQLNNVIDLQNGIHIEPVSANGQLYARVENKSNIHLKNCIVGHNGVFSQIFDLPPGSRTILLDTPLPGRNQILYRQTLIKIYGLNDPAKARSKQGSETIQALHSIVDDMVGQNSATVLIGWSDTDVNPVKINQKGERRINRTLFYLR